ncbi:MAG: hypothetical protein TR69_WS6001000047 [candidate division WS6 bacterium OLB20]|uniref:Uncharacterized protein n=1 Tax=candidate division WS6 bacterium OLB20 TaxID=1617426 RepID=A0A136M134_9BACT|nr:MAG: hypothetical protein TR69_WS6001000047 [candidate division WS6 bacterium OLB20]
MQDFESWQEEKKSLNNNVVVPQFRSFCKENGLEFMFWDELPHESFDARFSLDQKKLITEAMDLFNIYKLRYAYHEGRVYTYHFTTWAGDFSFDSYSIEEFLEHAGKTKYKEEKLNTWLTKLLSLAFFLILMSSSLILSNVLQIHIYISTIIGFAVAYIPLHLFFKKKSQILPENDRRVNALRVKIRQLKKNHYGDKLE